MLPRQDECCPRLYPGKDEVECGNTASLTSGGPAARMREMGQYFQAVLYYLDLSSKAGTKSKKPRFGVIQCIYQHTFAQRTFMWAAVSLYEGCWYDSSSGLWCSKESIGQTVPVLIRSLSHPLTVAVDGNLKIWFLDVFL